jgi:L-alanine-DL-glutamate epimerase-like enolase superfamily enzyme
LSGSLIWRIDAFEAVLPLPKTIVLGQLVIPHREYSFVRFYDDAGNVGTGFALSRNAPVSATFLRTIAPLWQGGPLDDHEALYDRAVKSNLPLGTNGIFWRALSLADCALYDLRAQRAGQPLAEFLGGQAKNAATMLVGGYPMPDETTATLAEEMRAMAAYHPAGVKIGSSGNYAADTRRLADCREVLPDGPPLMIDLHWGAPNAEAVLEHARQWDTFNMGWIEDPFGFDDFENIARLADGLSFPVAVGDEQSGIRHFRRLMDDGHIGVVRLDATACGGVRAFMTIAALAAERGLSVACHVYHHLHTQLASVVPNVRWVEYFLPSNGLDSINLVWNRDLAWGDDGLVTASEPGMGYDWNEAALQRYRRP